MRNIWTRYWTRCHAGASLLLTRILMAPMGRPIANGKTVINYSTESLTKAAAASRAVPTVVVVSEKDWGESKTMRAPLFGRTDSRGNFVQSDSVRVVRCPAEYRAGFSCADCGNGEPFAPAGIAILLWDLLRMVRARKKPRTRHAWGMLCRRGKLPDMVGRYRERRTVRDRRGKGFAVC
jgi:hypothetical protein